jgi:hypothetical protein
LKIVEFGASRLEDHHPESQIREILLVRKIAISSKENFEFLIRAPKQLTVLDSGPARFNYGKDFKPG